jgi:hypothetical protein
MRILLAAAFLAGLLTACGGGSSVSPEPAVQATAEVEQAAAPVQADAGPPQAEPVAKDPPPPLRAVWHAQMGDGLAVEAEDGFMLTKSLFCGLLSPSIDAKRPLSQPRPVPASLEECQMLYPGIATLDAAAFPELVAATTQDGCWLDEDAATLGCGFQFAQSTGGWTDTFRGLLGLESTMPTASNCPAETPFGWQETGQVVQCLDWPQTAQRVILTGGTLTVTSKFVCGASNPSGPTVKC